MDILFYCTVQLSFSFPIMLFVYDLGGLCDFFVVVVVGVFLFFV